MTKSRAIWVREPWNIKKRKITRRVWGYVLSSLSLSRSRAHLKRKLKRYPKESSLDVFISQYSLLGGWTWIRPRYGQAQVWKSGHVIQEKVSSMTGPYVSYYLYTKMYCYPNSVFPIFIMIDWWDSQQCYCHSLLYLNYRVGCFCNT